MHVICIICKGIQNLTLTCNANINMETVDTSQLGTNCPKNFGSAVALTSYGPKLHIKPTHHDKQYESTL